LSNQKNGELSGIFQVLGTRLEDRQIKSWIRSGERFEGRSDGDGLYLSYRESFAVPVWRFRYKLKGATRWVTMGNYTLSGQVFGLLP